MTAETESNDVHIWTVELDDADWDAFSSVLAPDEIDRADRFRRPHLRHRYRRCRIALRRLLGQISNEDPVNIALRYGPFGKPEMDGKWQFNLSHSEDKALIAISPHVVGIDLEFTNRPGMDVAALAEVVCHPNEIAALALLPADEKAALFYRWWTQKEAYCKARGTGLDDALGSLRCQPIPGTSVSLVLDAANAATQSYFAHELVCFPSYAASICLPLEKAALGMSAAQPAFFSEKLVPAK